MLLDRYSFTQRIRFTGGAIFGGDGDLDNFVIINPMTDGQKLVGNPGLNFVGDWDFQPQPVPEPPTWSLCGLGLGLAVPPDATR